MNKGLGHWASDLILLVSMCFDGACGVLVVPLAAPTTLFGSASVNTMAGTTTLTFFCSIIRICWLFFDGVCAMLSSNDGDSENNDFQVSDRNSSSSIATEEEERMNEIIQKNARSETKGTILETPSC